MEKSKAIEYGSRKLSPDVLKPCNIYIDSHNIWGTVKYTNFFNSDKMMHYFHKFSYLSIHQNVMKACIQSNMNSVGQFFYFKNLKHKGGLGMR
jgi:hypothetical protein